MLQRPQPQPIGWIRYLTLCAIGLSLVLAWLAPEASEGLGTLNALMFWFAHVVTGLGILAGVQVAIGRAPKFSNVAPWLQVVLGGLLGALVFVPAAFGLDLLFQPPATSDEILSGLLYEIWGEFSQIVVPFTVLWALLNAPTLVQLRQGSENGNEKSDEPQQDLPDPAREFWQKVPRALGRNLVALSAELHYLRVHTTDGNALILFAFGNAVGLLDGPRTCQIHRSHWVNLDQVESYETGNGSMTCVMRNGLRLPVSRPHRKALKLGLENRSPAPASQLTATTD